MRILAIFILVAAMLALAVAIPFSHDMAERRARLAATPTALVPTPFGNLEYAVRGSGPPVLMIHGTGGGFDQGLTFTEALKGHEIIAPSRFGYLRSAFPKDPSSEHQADAFVALLDNLNISKLPVAGGSAGALSAVQFALRHPDRTSALILIVPAANVRGRDPVAMGRTAEWLVRRLVTSDILFWSAAKLARGQMIGTLLATDPALVKRASPAERDRVSRILNEIMPVSSRWRGMLNDAKLAGNPARVDFTKIRVPTLVISVEDDRFGTAATARDIAAAVPGARLIIYPTGGHVFVAHDAELWSAVSAFLKGLAPPTPAPRNPAPARCAARSR